MLRDRAYPVHNEQTNAPLYVLITQGMALGYYILNEDDVLLAEGRDYYDMEEVVIAAERCARTCRPLDI